MTIQKLHSALLDEIVPHYNESHPVNKRILALQEVVENYSRYVAQQIKFPPKVLDKYNRLVVAIKNIQRFPVEHVDKEQLLRDYPELKNQIAFIEHCLMYYLEVLSGELDHMSVFFPEGKLDLLKSLSHSNPTFDYYNNMAAMVVSNYITKKEISKVNILEIGAGKGDTTKFILPLLKSAQPIYYFTDISKGFFREAKNAFSAYPFLIYQTYDVETEPTIFTGKFDCIIATNVLHATTNIRNSIANLCKLLTKDGILVLHELTERHDFATITFGLTDGWWRYNDTRIPDTPLLSQQGWEDILKNNGFSSVKTHGSSKRKVIAALYEN